MNYLTPAMMQNMLGQAGPGNYQQAMAPNPMRQQGGVPTQGGTPTQPQSAAAKGAGSPMPANPMGPGAGMAMMSNPMLQGIVGGNQQAAQAARMQADQSNSMALDRLRQAAMLYLR